MNKRYSTTIVLGLHKKTCHKMIQNYAYCENNVNKFEVETSS